MVRPALRSVFFDWALFALAVLATSAAVGVHLGGGTLRQETPAELARALEGKRLPPLPTYSSDGKLLEWVVPTDGRRRLLLVFNSTCPYCDLSVPAWSRLVEIFDGVGDVHLLNDQSWAISQQWISERDLGQYASVVVAQPGGVAEWGIPGFPATLLLQGDTVLLAHFGALTTAGLSKWETFVNLTAAK